MGATIPGGEPGRRSDGDADGEMEPQGGHAPGDAADHPSADEAGDGDDNFAVNGE